MKAQKARTRKIKSLHMGVCCPFKCFTKLKQIKLHAEGAEGVNDVQFYFSYVTIGQKLML
jgi:hypothetical protein